MFTILYILINYCNFAHAQNFPDYWVGKIHTFDNASMDNPTPFIMQSAVKEYSTLNISSGRFNINQMQTVIADPDRTKIPQQYLGSNEPPVNVSGKVRKVTLKKGMFTYLEVLQKFNYKDDNTVPVHFSSSWYETDESESIDHTNEYLIDALTNGNILNISMLVDYRRLSDAETESFNKDRKFEIEEYLCYYPGYVSELIDDRCFIPYKELIALYKDLWSTESLRPPALNGELFIVTNNEHNDRDTERCDDWAREINKDFDDLDFDDIDDWWRAYNNYEDNNCRFQLAYFRNAKFVHEDVVFLKKTYVYYELNSQPVGIGLVDNMTYGFNKTMNTHDLNFTVHFSNWTIDFSAGILDSYRDISFNYENFELCIYYWTADPIPKPVRGIPVYFCAIVIILMFPFSVLFCALGVLTFTCSEKSFVESVWDYRKRFRKYVRQQKSKTRQQKEQERIKAYEEKQMNNNYLREYEKIQENMNARADFGDIEAPEYNKMYVRNHDNPTYMDDFVQ